MFYILVLKDVKIDMCFMIFIIITRKSHDYILCIAYKLKIDQEYQEYYQY